MNQSSEVQWGSMRPILQDLADRITRIEQFLAASGLQAASQPTDSFGGVADAVPGSFHPAGSAVGQAAAAAHGVDSGTNFDPSQAGVPPYIVQMAMGGQLIQAIKEYRDLTGIGLKEAKAIIEQASIRGY